ITRRVSATLRCETGRRRRFHPPVPASFAFAERLPPARGPQGEGQFRDLSTSRFFAIHGIMARRRSPTASMGWAADVARIALNEGWPALFSSTQSRAKRPCWMSAKISFIAALLAGPTTRGPETYSPYSAVLETE